MFSNLKTERGFIKIILEGLELVKGSVAFMSLLSYIYFIAFLLVLLLSIIIIYNKQNHFTINHILLLLLSKCWIKAM